MLKGQFSTIWNQLRAKKPHFADYLEGLHIRVKESEQSLFAHEINNGLRGITNLNIRFEYPVSVIAGPNACGKTTILYALACAYKVPGSGIRDFVPSTMFPEFRTDDDLPNDNIRDISMRYSYMQNGNQFRMQWAKYQKNWNRSYMGERHGKQPIRNLYMRTLANLSNPSEVRSVLNIGRTKSLDIKEISADLLSLAYRILPFKYDDFLQITNKTGKELLFVHRDDGAEYSEFHMSAGERSILRLSRDISAMNNALILIDEVEAGLHPFTQQQLMLELQRLALRNDLQIVVATHSPVIFESVPIEGRIFLERAKNNVKMQLAHKDLMQKAFYGNSLEKLYILCEDKTAESIVRGVLDYLNPQLSLRHSDIDVGRNTGKEEFPNHVRSLAKFKQLDNFLFILDGDAIDLKGKITNAAYEQGQAAMLLFLPGDIPEDWVWDQLSSDSEYYANEFGMPVEELEKILRKLANSFAGSTDKPSNIAKERLYTFCDVYLKRPTEDVCRLIGRKEVIRGLRDFSNNLKEKIENWRLLLG